MHLSEEAPVEIERSRWLPGLAVHAAESVTWRTFTLGVIHRLGLLLRPRTAAVFAVTTIGPHCVCLVTLGPTRRLREGERLPFKVSWRSTSATGGASTDPRETTLYRDCVAEVSESEPWTEYRFALDKVAGTSGSIVVECSGRWPIGRKPEELALYDLVIGDERSLDLERARSFRSLRIRNERINFDAYYQHAAFQPDATVATASGAVEASSGNAQSIASPARVVTAIEYSHRRLLEKMKLERPALGWQRQMHNTFEAFRASRKAGDASKFRVLSLCSGAARLEFDLVRGIPPESLSLTLLDVNSNLLGQARRKLSSWGDVDTIEGDVNALDLGSERFHVIMCVSALHHIVELEHVIGEATRAIGDSGQFWSIGETLGRNGGRMWPDAYAVANAYFRDLDAKYRRNRITGAVDESLPDLDYSIGCFEGIRAESIEPTLLRFLRPRKVSKHNCIVWRLFSLAYSDNFDMGVDEDRASIDRAIDLDISLHQRGPYAVELHGTYAGSQTS